ncbi:MAG: YfhO family protein [Blastochloris sp.]|nr:YfhO family protein [Blastochloris sp.]
MLHRGDPVHQLWTLRWTQHALFNDPANLFAANANYPFDAALTLNQPMYTNAVLTAPIQWFFNNQALTHNAGVLLSFVLAGTFTALLVQQLTGNRWAALAAGILYAFAPVRQAHIFHLNLLSGYWTPLVLWGLHRLWQVYGRRELQLAQHSFFSTLLLGLLISVAYAAQVLSEFYHAIYLALAIALFLLWHLIVHRWGLSWQGTVTLIASGAFGVALTLPILLPTVQAWEMLDLERSIAEHDRHGARLENYLVTDRKKRVEYGLWRFNHRSATSGSAEHSLFPGALAVPLAVLGVVSVRRWRNTDALLYVVMALIAFWLSLGPTIRVGEGPEGIPSPLYVWIYEHLPGFSGTRVPSRFAMLVQLALAVLAGYGIAYLCAKLSGRWSKWSPMLGSVILLLLALDFWGPGIRGTQGLVGEPLPEIYTELAAQPPGAILEYPVMNANEMLPHRYEYFSTFHWRPLVNSGSGILPQAYIELRDILNTFPEQRAVRLLQELDVRYVVVHRYQMSGWEAWWSLVQVTPGVQVVAQSDDMGDVLLAIEPRDDEPALTLERWTTTDGEQKVLFEALSPFIIDRDRFYARWHTQSVLLEYRDGRTEQTEVYLPTYLTGGVLVVDWPDLYKDVVAVQLPTSHGVRRVPLDAPPTPTRTVEGPQMLGRSLPSSIAVGEMLPCRLYGKGPIDSAGLVLSLNLVDANGVVQAKEDRFFDEGFAAPEHWPATGAEPVPCMFAIPADIPAGIYTFEVGLYNPTGNEFISFADPDGQIDYYWKRAITVTP